LLQEYVAAYGIKGVIDRCGLIAGPWQMGKVDQGVVTLWVARHMFGKPLAYIGLGGSGKQVRDVLHVEDLVDAVLLQMKDLGKFSGQVFNLGGGSGNAVSLLELTALCEKVTGKKIPIGRVKEDRPADIPWFVTDSSKFSKLTGWIPKRSVEDTVADIAQWLGGREMAAHLGAGSRLRCSGLFF
jgi:CDP-paratose 2-epimerase